jgi:hypothetical protein
MENAEFEEKDFEGALYHSLAAGFPHLWTPGQVFEHHFGIDAALHTLNEFFLRAVASYPLKGVVLRDLRWGYVARRVGRRPRMPSFRANALIQAKRPQHLKGAYGNLIPHGITGQYWRFAVVKHQQRLLERLYRKIKHRAVVTYACPSFHLWDDLDTHLSNGTIAQHCSYVSIAAMSGHDHWCFDAPGGAGVALSEPEKVQGSPLAEQFAAVAGTLRDSTTSSAAHALAEFGTDIVSATTEETENGNKLAAALGRVLLNTGDGPAETVAARHFVNASAFATYTACDWFVVGKADSA